VGSPSCYDGPSLRAKLFLFLTTKLPSHRGTMKTAEFDFCFNIKVVALCLNFPTHGHGPQFDTRSSSYGLQSEKRSN
ncbi:hypothetical protein A2U01_0092285, partial [Trifolium medium]|nr:hypothetical protein [Trifolium medium]